MSEKDRIPELFGSMSFNEGTMEQYVPHQAMEVWRDCLKSGKPLPLTAANDIAEAMKTWALEHGATHFTHWFQPLSGVTAEKHDSFINPIGGGKIIMVLVLFTMIFNAGMIPNYLLIRNLGLYDNRWALVLPMLVSAYNCIIMKSFFLSIPESLEESARIDGANDMRIFFSIILPLSKATIATILLFNAVMYWNDYFSTVLYIQATDKWSLQAVLRNMLTNTQQAMQAAGVNVRAQSNTNAVTIKAASIVVATVPILVVYPFVQKYFVKGVMIGGVKG